MALALQAPTARPPLRRKAMVRRPRLVRALRMARDVPLAVLVAPAGYGKTTLLAEWAREDARPFAWIGGGEVADGDSDVLLDAVATVLDELEPVDGDTLDALSQREPFVLVVDDAHLLRPPSIRTLGVVAQLLGPGSTLALASRCEPQLGLGRLRAHRLVVELHARDLAMTRNEAAALLDKAGLAPDPRTVVEVAARTEGWPAALYLAAVSAKEQPDPALALTGFGGDDRLIVDYLCDEILGQLSRESSVFLTESSVLHRLSGPVCDAVLGRRGSAQLLRDLSRGNALLTCLDRHDGEYRVHPLLAETLKSQLNRTRPERAAVLRRRASAWHEGHGDMDAAIDLAVEGHDVQRSSELLARVASAYVATGRATALESWLQHFSDDEVNASAGLALTAAATRLVDGDSNRIEQLADAAACASRPEHDLHGSIQAGVGVMRALVQRAGAAEMGEDAASARRRDADDGPWASLCTLVEGVSQHLLGHTEIAEPLLEDAARRGAQRAPIVHVLARAQLALLAIDREDWTEAATNATRARMGAERAGISEYPACALVYAVSALIRAHHDRVEDAQRELLQARRLLSMLAGFAPWYEAEAKIVVARVALRLSDVAGARTSLSEASTALRETPDAVTLAAWLEDAWARADTYAAAAVGGPSALTTAELRILRFLPSHLSFREIGARMHVSINTVKTQAHAVYRKLDACSRTEAVTRARTIGLLDG
jgi:LuxR family maltose regulon positive regulatory protein